MSTTVPTSSLQGNSASIVQTAPNPPALPPESRDGRIECLSRSPLFARLSAIQYREVSSVAQELFYRENETVFLQGNVVRYVFVVASGTVKISRVCADGNNTLLWIERAGDWIDDSFSSSHVHSVRARTSENSILLAWQGETFDLLAARIPVIPANMMRITHARLQLLQQRYCDLSNLPVSQRLARAILQLGSGATNAVSGLSRGELAQMTGTSMFTVSRLLSDWAESEIVTLEPRKVSIEDKDRLVELAESAT